MEVNGPEEFVERAHVPSVAGSDESASMEIDRTSLSGMVKRLRDLENSIPDLK